MTMETPSRTVDIHHMQAAVQFHCQRVGLRVFLLGALVQTLLVYFFTITAATFGYYRRTHEGSEIWSWGELQAFMQEQLPLWMGIAMGGLALAVVAMPFGRWAGKMIGIRKRSLAWVGPLAALVPSLTAGFALVLAVLVMKPSLYDHYEESFLDDFLLPALVFSLFYYLPGIVTSLMGGLVIRQLTRAKLVELSSQEERHSHA